jgi:hypothetical protein
VATNRIAKNRQLATGLEHGRLDSAHPQLLGKVPGI